MGPDALAFEMGVNVVHDRLPKGWLGAYHHESRTVTLAPGLHRDRVRYCSVLSHELGHAHYGHTAADRAWGERAADKFAAGFLIRMDDYLDAMSRTGDIHAAAKILGVLPWVVSVYQSTLNGGLYARIGNGLMPPRELPEPGAALECLAALEVERELYNMSNAVLL